MTSLLLTLRGPLQAWGTSSRFTRRTTESHPSKSGILGLCAAAMGRRRTDPIEDLLGLRIAVRLDVPGSLLRDFQTALPLTPGQAMPLTYRDYLQDATFVVAVSGDLNLLEGLASALRSPKYPLYLGRRSCVPAGPIVPTVVDGNERDAASAAPWAALDRIRLSSPKSVQLEVVADALESDPTTVLVRDVPLSFDPQRREYGYRPIQRYWVAKDNPEGLVDVLVGSRADHDPMAMELP